MLSELLSEFEVVTANLGPRDGKHNLLAICAGILLSRAPERAAGLLEELPTVYHEEAFRYFASVGGLASDAVSAGVRAWWRALPELKFGTQMALGLWANLDEAEKDLGALPEFLRAQAIVQSVTWGMPRNVMEVIGWAALHVSGAFLDRVRQALVETRNDGSQLIEFISEPAARLSSIIAAGEHGATVDCRIKWLRMAEEAAGSIGETVSVPQVNSLLARAAAGVDEEVSRRYLEIAWNAATREDVTPHAFLGATPCIVSAAARVGIGPWRNIIESVATDRRLRRLPTERQSLLTQLTGSAFILPRRDHSAAIEVLRGLSRRIEFASCQLVVQSWIAWLSVSGGLAPTGRLAEFESMLKTISHGPDLVLVLRKVAQRMAFIDAQYALRMSEHLREPRSRALWLLGVIDPKAW